MWFQNDVLGMNLIKWSVKLLVPKHNMPVTWNTCLQSLSCQLPPFLADVSKQTTSQSSKLHTL